ncbi:hypothetical protein ACIQUW_09505 [Streptomyces sp. NPDC101117]|uniref:hypothetical protein n=1 Tax=Streptomyces sp. NPDC101117 TaxID=3366108 RepID=UPI00380D5BA9
MSSIQDHLLDTHRARWLGEAEPPAPGSHDRRVLREMREMRELREFRAVLAGRPARGPVRRALDRWRHA